MERLIEEIEGFLAARKAAGEHARQSAAFFLMSGVDLETAMAAPPDERRRITLRLERLIERERLKGIRRHWSYDLNRHIALKQAIDRLKVVAEPDGGEAGFRPIASSIRTIRHLEPAIARPGTEKRRHAFAPTQGHASLHRKRRRAE